MYFHFFFKNELSNTILEKYLSICNRPWCLVLKEHGVHLNMITVNLVFYRNFGYCVLPILLSKVTYSNLKVSNCLQFNGRFSQLPLDR